MDGETELGTISQREKRESEGSVLGLKTSAGADY